MTKYPFEFNDKTPKSSDSSEGQEPAKNSPTEPDSVATGQGLEGAGPSPEGPAVPLMTGETIDAHIPPLAETETLKAKLAEREEQLMRLAAEVENMRKRHAQELANASKFAIEGFAEAMLPVGDSLEMALQLPNQTLEGLKDGVNITLKQLHQAFEKGRLSVVNPVGEKFDPNKHQAVSMVDGASQEPPVASGHVVLVMQKGYLIGDRVLRPALVAVAQ